jgi:hypothetical protein
VEVGEVILFLELLLFLLPMVEVVEVQPNPFSLLVWVEVVVQVILLLPLFLVAEVAVGVVLFCHRPLQFVEE